MSSHFFIPIQFCYNCNDEKRVIKDCRAHTSFVCIVMNNRIFYFVCLSNMNLFTLLWMKVHHGIF